MLPQNPSDPSLVDEDYQHARPSHPVSSDYSGGWSSAPPKFYTPSWSSPDSPQEPISEAEVYCSSNPARAKALLDFAAWYRAAALHNPLVPDQFVEKKVQMLVDQVARSRLANPHDPGARLPRGGIRLLPTLVYFPSERLTKIT